MNPMESQLTSIHEHLLKVDHFYLNLYYCIRENIPTNATARFMPSHKGISYIRNGTRGALNNLKSILNEELNDHETRDHILAMKDMLKPLFEEFMRTVLSEAEHEIKISSDAIKETLNQALEQPNN